LSPPKVGGTTPRIFRSPAKPVALEKADRLNPKFWMTAGISACDEMLVVGRTVVVVAVVVVVVD
jgi:hypothetical protein